MTGSVHRQRPVRRLSVVGPMCAGLAALALVAAVVVAAPAPAGALGSTLYAAQSATGANSCADAGDACTLQTALDLAANGDTIDLLAGTFTSGSSTFQDAQSVTIQP